MDHYDNACSMHVQQKNRLSTPSHSPSPMNIPAVIANTAPSLYFYYTGSIHCPGPGVRLRHMECKSRNSSSSSFGTVSTTTPLFRLLMVPPVESPTVWYWYAGGINRLWRMESMDVATSVRKHIIIFWYIVIVCRHSQIKMLNHRPHTLPHTKVPPSAIVLQLLDCAMHEFAIARRRCSSFANLLS